MKTSVQTCLNKATGEITQKTTSVVEGLADKMYVAIIKTQQEGIRRALIKLGWTPPKGR